MRLFWTRLTADYSTLAERLNGKMLLLQCPHVHWKHGEDNRTGKASGRKVHGLSRNRRGNVSLLIIEAYGVVVAVANVAPELCAELWEVFRDGKPRQARELQLRINLIDEVVGRRYNQISA